jgi:hypothetical protein
MIPRKLAAINGSSQRPQWGKEEADPGFLFRKPRGVLRRY